MSKFSEEERAAILARSYELLSDHAPDARQISEPELSREQILQAALAWPIESTNDRHRREIAEREAQRAARDHNELLERAAMARLEARLIARIASQGAAQRQVAFELVSEALEMFDEEVCAPLARQLTDLQAEVKALREKRSPELSAEPIDLPLLDLPSRRMQ